MPARLKVLVLVATFGSLRWGEVSALRRRGVDAGTGSVPITAAFSERSRGGLVLGPPKSRAGVRTVTVPAAVAAALAGHLETFTDAAPDAWVFPGEKGGPVRRSNFNKLTRWTDAVAAVGAEGLHFHDLRHTGNMLAAATPGASLRDLMVRMGHDSMRAALIYQHANRDADGFIAAARGQLIAAETAAQDAGAEAEREDRDAG